MVYRTAVKVGVIFAGRPTAAYKGSPVPMLFIHGDRDASIPLEITSGPASRLVKNARLVVYEGAPHGLYITHKDRLNADLLQFFTSNVRALAHAT